MKEKTKKQLLKMQDTQIRRISNIVSDINDAGGLIKTSVLRKIEKSSPNATKKQMQKRLDDLKNIKRKDLNKEVVGYMQPKEEGGLKITKGEEARKAYREARRGQLEDERLRKEVEANLIELLSMQIPEYKRYNGGYYNATEYQHSKGIMVTEHEKEIYKLSSKTLRAWNAVSDEMTADQLTIILNETNVTSYLGYTGSTRYKDALDNIYKTLTDRHLPASGIM